jgi:hypothetical protein
MYSRGKEDGIEQAFIDIGFDLVEDTGRRKKHHADKIMRNEDVSITVAIDHKSTTNKEGIRITKDMLDKIKLEAGKDMIPILTFSLYDMQRKFAIIEIEDLGVFCK